MILSINGFSPNGLCENYFNKLFVRVLSILII
jgi:hypothetical protein